MKTIKLPYHSDFDFSSLIKQYSSVVRWSYNCFLENKKEKDIRQDSKYLNNIDLLNSWLIQCAILDGKAIKRRFKDNKVIFGGKSNFIKRLKNKITKDKFNELRLNPLTVQGEELQKGNRLFSLDVIENNQIIFKLTRSNHIKLKLPNLRNNIKKELFNLELLNNIKSKQKGYTFSIKLDSKYIYISFQEFKEELASLVKTRYIGIDMNPDNIGISVMDNGKVIHAQEFNLKLIFDKILNNKLSSDSHQMKYLQNKLKFEIIEISKSISEIAKKYKCKNVFVEDLKFKGKSEIKISNRKNKNLWKREIFVNNLTKRLNIFGINIYHVNPAYSSFIGNMQYDYSDSVNASIEIGRRGFEYFVNKSKDKFYPVLSAKHQWKEMAADFMEWKKFFNAIKNLKLKYRVSLDECQHSFNVFQQNSTMKSMVLNYVFY